MPTKRSPPRPAPSGDPATVATIERLLEAQAPTLAKRAPKQLQDMKTLLRELKSGKPPTPTSQQMMRALVVWQLDAKRADYEARLDSMPSSDLKGRRAFENMIRVVDEAKKALAVAPNPQSMRAVELASSRAKLSLQEAGADRAPPSLPVRGPTDDPDATPPPPVAARPMAKAAPKPLGSFRAPPPGTAINSPAWVAARSEPKKPTKK